MHDILRGTEELRTVLDYGEEPVGVYYTDTQPEGGFHPKGGEPVTREREAAGAINFAAARENWSCILGHLWLARKKHGTAWFAADHYGCMGGSFFTGFTNPSLEQTMHYVSTGIPGVTQGPAKRGERYMPSPDAMRRFVAAVENPAPAKYCVIKPLSAFSDGEKPLTVLFFARPETLFGLTSLVWFATGNAEAIAFPFGAGCTNLITWPLRYLKDGKEKAVLGGADLSCRKFMKQDELSLALPLGLYTRMLAALPESALYGETWPEVKKKAARNKTAE